MGQVSGDPDEQGRLHPEADPVRSAGGEGGGILPDGHRLRGPRDDPVPAIHTNLLRILHKTGAEVPDDPKRNEADGQALHHGYQGKLQHNISNLIPGCFRLEPGPMDQTRLKKRQLSRTPPTPVPRNFTASVFSG